MNITKMHGAGNDFIMINNFREKLQKESLSALAVKLCERRMSVGADGLMVLDKAEKGGDYRMIFYNADGSEGEMCGNGSRCVARFAFEEGIGGEVQHIETLSGTVTAWRVNTVQYRVRLNDPSVIQLNKSILVDNNLIICDYVELGSPGLPHAVVEFPKLDHISDDKLRSLGATLRHAPEFPKGANVNFWRRIDDDSFEVRTFERGVEDFTLACGTGCGSTAAALTLHGLCSGKNVHLLCRGGELILNVTRCGDSISDIMMTGPTRVVFRGEYYLE